MKKYIGCLLLTLFVALMGWTATTQAKADSLNKYWDSPQPIRCTCYVEHGQTASGQWTRPHTVAGPREWLGCVGALYRMNEDGSMGEFLGYYEFIDTGAGIDTDGDGRGDSIINGESIDVWRPDIEMAREWVDLNGDYVYLKLVKGEG